MNISFYTATTGAQQQQNRLDVHGNNIANINTYGFRAKQPSFSQLMTGPVRGIRFRRNQTRARSFVEAISA